jgi:hypothetical protein
MQSVSHQRAVEQDDDMPELLLLAHPPHVLSVLFGIALDGTTTQLRGNHTSNMALRGMHMLVVHLVHLPGVRSENEKDQPDGEDFDTQQSRKVVPKEVQVMPTPLRSQEAGDDKNSRQEIHGDCCKIASLPSHRSCYHRGGSRVRRSPNFNACATRHGLSV